MVTEKVFEVRRKAVFSKDMKKRYELNIECMNEGKKEKAILSSYRFFISLLNTAFLLTSNTFSVTISILY